MTDRVQEQVFAFLADPATHGGESVQRIDTHAASVFLANGRALKVKRAVRFPFLDYSTLARRKAACESEMEINRPFAPAIYRGVVAITRESDGRLAIGGEGEPVEYAVDMHRFDENATLDHLAWQGRIDAALADALGRMIAAAHAAAKPVEAAPLESALRDYVEQNDEALQAMPILFPPERVTALTTQSLAAHARLAPLLAARGRLGLIRRGHGDLHLGNIALIEGKPMLFDAIEFDPLIAAGDVLYDLGFLLMDLVERGLREVANIVFNRYLLETQRAANLDALAALPLFMSVRAAIRAKVSAARTPPAQSEARNYFDLALRLIAPRPPRLIAIGGLSGTGKSVLARALAPFIAPAPGAVHLRSDVERKLLFERGERDRLPPTAYTPVVTERVYATLAEKGGRILAAGHSAIVDAVFADAAERDLLRRAGATGLFLTADLGTRVARVGKRVGDASDADAEVARSQERYDLGTLDWITVDASGTPEETLARARAALGIDAGR